MFRYVVIIDSPVEHWSWIPAVSADPRWVAFMAVVLGGAVIEV